MSPAFATQVGHLAVRTIVRTARQPANVVASLAFPMALLAVNSGGLEAATDLRGFPTDSFVAFALAVPFIQGALFSTINAGADLARDIQTGFLNRLSRDDGVTVFLTTQYLEEADLLADRVGIIDHGRIVAEGTPTALKAEIGRPTVDAVPADPADREAVAAILERFGERTAASPKGVAVRLVHGEEDLAEISRALDAEGLHVEHLQLHAPSLDDVFLAKTGRSLEGAEERPEVIHA